MADKKIGDIVVYADDDGKAVWEFEGKIQSDIPLDTDAQDLAGAINELKKLSEQEGGENYAKPWTRPPDWPVLPVPGDNQVIFLVSTARNPSPYCSIVTRQLDKYAFPENKGAYPEGLTASVNWGDGHVSSAVLNDKGQMEWTNSFGNNNPTADTTETTDVNAGNYYFYYSGTDKFWNSGGTKLNDGSMVFIVTVTVSDPQNVVIGWPTNCDTFEAYIGKNINIDKNETYYYSYHLQHVKAFGWQPGKNKDKRMSSYNSNTGAISWNESGIFGNNVNLRKIDATDSFTEIPDNMCRYIRVPLEIDLSKAEKIGSNAFNNSCLFENMLSLTKCAEIGNQGFYECKNLTAVNAPALISIGSGAFRDCRDLKAVYAPELESVSISAFENCYSLFTVNVFKAEFVMPNGFSFCYALQEINAPLLKGLGANAFCYCYSLNELDAPELYSVGTNAFSSCFALKKLVCAEGTNLSGAGLDYSFLLYDNPTLKNYRPNDVH